MLQNPVTDIDITMEVKLFPTQQRRILCAGGRKDSRQRIGSREARWGQRNADRFHRRSERRFRHTIQNLRDKLDIKLSGSTASQLATHPIQYETGFTLLPGKYVIKYLARDAETGRIGTYQMAFTVPNLNKEVNRFPSARWS